MLEETAGSSQWVYHGCDISERIMDFCRQEHQSDRFHLIPTNGSLPFDTDALDIVLCSGSLQYCEDWRTALEEVCRIARRYVVVSRLPCCKYHDSFILGQTVASSHGEENHALHVLNRGEVTGFFEQRGMSIQIQEAGVEAYGIPCLSETIIHMGFLARKTSD